MDKKDIEAKLNELDIENYIISEDGIVDVKSSVDISFKNLKEIPVQFGIVKGDFNCSNNQLVDLKGIPISIRGVLYCTGNHIPLNVVIDYKKKCPFLIICDQDK